MPSGPSLRTSPLLGLKTSTPLTFTPMAFFPSLRISMSGSPKMTKRLLYVRRSHDNDTVKFLSSLRLAPSSRQLCQQPQRNAAAFTDEGPSSLRSSIAAIVDDACSVSQSDAEFQSCSWTDRKSLRRRCGRTTPFYATHW
jgi:hypothetical protein